MSLLGYEGPVIGILLIFYLIFPNKIHTLCVISYIGFIGYMMTFLKLIYHDPRPYWSYDTINGYGCDGGFGKPSGHAFTSVVIFYFLIDGILKKQFQKTYSSSELIDFIQNKNENNEQLPFTQNINEFNTQLQGLSQFSWPFYVYLLLIILIGFSRIYLGVHSYNQVILGWLYGVFFVCLYFELAQKRYEKIMAKYIYKCFKSTQDYVKHLSIVTGIYVFIIFVTVIAFYRVDNSISEEQMVIWLEKIATCKDNMDLSITKIAQNKIFLDSGSISISYSLLITTMLTMGEYTPEDFQNNWSSLRISKKLLRFLIIVLVVGVPFLVMHYVYLTVTNIYFLYALKSIFTFNLVMFCFIKVVPYALAKLNLDIKGDLFRFLPEQSFFNCRLKYQDFLSNDYL
ncbi:Phosphatidic acid phosphatase type 2/haloperoxidase [Pseudocohnilembus persalinus]|uniref:Phosphatidic acid phosphatase type 2/haloperoxidase n=1 Tax=Pseudocohnilembus persalinus TaxID=266149 RepID=A0A0V0R5V6_PSEPJ|nr:Phosphatidic acid phosphatase type 2/haloperoxidase [Pseudocohnilembus persalinus]|eukprot:KRX09560.1 Phosphatidic acid phosphatase type 2/haloperoxidase [Pseudocohnilembus persalinus]